MKKRTGLGLLWLITLLFINGCSEKTFTLAYLEKSSTDIVIEGDTIVLPTNSKFLEENELTRFFKFYDYETGDEVSDITFDGNFDNTQPGIYDLNITGKLENKVGNVTLKVQYVESCSGECVINTTNWKFELFGITKYTDYSPNYKLNVKVKMYPTEKAHYNPYLLNLANYDDFYDGAIKLYYKDYLMDSELAYDPSSQQADNALTLYYEKNKNSIKQDTYIQFVTVPKLEDEAYIDFYDKTTKEHHFYYVN